MKRTFITIVLLMSLSLILSSCVKKADPIVLPSIDEIIAVEIVSGNEDIIQTDKVWIKSFVQKINEAKPTSKESIQDVPTKPEYIRVDFVSDGKISSIFVYKENSKYYIEQPYKGIYETDDTIQEFLI